MTITTADYDTIVVGGGPSGATAAHDLTRKGHSVLLLERGFRIKPCGGAIPPCLLEEFDILGDDTPHEHVAAGDGATHHEQPRIEPVIHDRMLGATQFVDARDDHVSGTDALDLSAHLA